MGFTRQRKQSSFVIKSKKNLLLELITLILTVCMWIYSIIVIYLFISAIFNHNDNFISIIKTALKVNNSDIQEFLAISILFFVLSFIILSTWRIYNKKRFGKLNRRSKPEDSTDEDILRLKLINIEDYEKMKNNRIIVFENNPIKELSKEGVLNEEVNKK